MENETGSTKVSTQLEALNCLAATAGKLITTHDANKDSMTTENTTSIKQTEEPELNEDIKIPQQCTETSSCNVPQTFTNSAHPFNGHESVMHEFPFMNNGFSMSSSNDMSPKTSIFSPTPRMCSSQRSSPKQYINTPYDPEKSLFNAMTLANSYNGFSNNSYNDPTIYHNKDIHQKVRDKVPLPFGMDSLLNDSTLFETLVQESQKMLSKDDQINKIKNIKSSVNNFENNQQQYNDISQINNPSNDSKPIKKRRPKSGIGEKRTHGGPPFKPGSEPPKENTYESSLCAFYEHTLLKMATRGFWSGDKGVLQDVFRLARVENSDLQYSMKEITGHCYNIVKSKLEAVQSSEREPINQLMKSYVEEFDNYLERIHPVSSVAINVYLPTATDYAAATWHGIVPTGWSEYRRAVVIREVFEVLHHFSTSLSEIPNFHSSFFDKKVHDPTLAPVELLNCPFLKPTDTDEVNEEILKRLKDNVNYSRVFHGLWTRSAPHMPVVILNENVKMNLREYYEKYPIELYAPPDTAVIIVDNKKYKAREVLGYFRRGVQLVDYSKDTGGTIIDTVSTIQNVSMTSAVRKIPPGRISKLIHSDLHLENYTNAILEIDSEESLNVATTTAKQKSRKRKIKRTPKVNKEKKLVDDGTNHHEEDEDHLKENSIKLQSISTFCNSLGTASEESVSLTADIKNAMNSPTSSSINLPNISGDPYFSYPYPQLNQSEADNRNFFPEENKSKYPRQNFQQTPPQFYSEQRLDGLRNPFEVPSPAGILRPKPDFPLSTYTPDILSSMNFPPNTGEMFSLHVMIDSYRRAAKYLLDTANHLELVARRTSNNILIKKESPNSSEAKGS